MAHIYAVEYASARPGEALEPSGFPMVMKIPRMTAGDGAENIVSFEVELQILPVLSGPHVPRFVAAGEAGGWSVMGSRQMATAPEALSLVVAAERAFKP